MSDLTACSGGMLVLFKQIHYHGSSLSIPHGEAWQKIYGPILLYCNSSPDGGNGCWADAKRQAKAEQAAWPCSWLTGEKAYPLKSGRGTVGGKFVVHDRLKPRVCGSNAWVGLAQPPPGGNWQFESANYQYWVHADADGNFSIPHVRPGTYTLYAFTTGAVGEFSQTNVEVKAGQTTALSNVVWNVWHPGARIAWQIGLPNRSAIEFRHGNDYSARIYGRNFPANFPILWTTSLASATGQTTGITPNVDI